MKIFSRILFSVIAIGLAVDVCPPVWLGNSKAKLVWSEWLSRVGLWQGQWSMFSPDPVLNNAWIVAEFEEADGTTTEWISPNWREAGTVEKFIRFRELNFFNRLYIDRNAPAWNDFADWLKATQAPASTKLIRLTRNQFRMSPIIDDQLPAQEETTWILSSDFLLERSYTP